MIQKNFKKGVFLGWGGVIKVLFVSVTFDLRPG